MQVKNINDLKKTVYVKYVAWATENYFQLHYNENISRTQLLPHYYSAYIITYHSYSLYE